MGCKKNKLFIFLILILISMNSIFIISAETISDSTSTNIEVSGGLGCSYNTTYSEWRDYRVEGVITITDSRGNCNDPDGTTTATCCPSGLNCIDSGSGTFYCGHSGITYCNQYDSSASCNDFTQDVADTSVLFELNQVCGVDANEVHYYNLGGAEVLGQDVTNGIYDYFCYKNMSCSCEWDPLNPPGGSCTTKAVNGTICKNKDGTDNSAPIYSECIFTLNTWNDTCDTKGVITGTWAASGSNHENFAGCEDVTKVISCESMVKLSFFTTAGIISVIILIILIYIFYPKLNPKSSKNPKPTKK